MKFLSKVSDFFSKPSLTPFQFLLLAILFLATLGSLSFAWTAPSATAPNGNVAAPINTGSAIQIKNGAFGANSLAIYGNSYLQDNLGIGTTAAGGDIEISRDGTDSSIRFHDPADAHYAVGIDVSDGRKFKINYGALVGDAAHFTMLTDGRIGIGNTAPQYSLDVNGEIIADGWLRTRGNRGWYNQDYGGGWYMSDTTWIRAYQNKNVITGGQLRGGQLCIGSDCRSSWPTGGISAVTTASCTSVGDYDSTAYCSVSCPSGYYRTGCGIGSAYGITGSGPSGSNGCYAQGGHNVTAVAYAYCAR